MKCPKCGYLGFETTDRCRHCGYDFSLSTHTQTPPELPLRPAIDPEAPLSDFDLSAQPPTPTDHANALDLNRVIGSDQSARQTNVRRASTAVATPPAGEVDETYADRDEAAAAALPLFKAPSTQQGDGPLITSPRPVRPPLAVRRSTPEVTRRRTPRTIRRDEGPLDLDLEPAAAPSTAAAASDGIAPAASRIARLASSIIDLALLAAIDAAVLYFTLAIAGLSFEQARKIPVVPMGAFLLLLNGGYLIAFVAAGGQTIGKMIARIRVVRDHGGSVDVAGAVLRMAGALVSIATLGLAYLPALMSADGRALHDRLAGTRVVKAM